MAFGAEKPRNWDVYRVLWEGVMRRVWSRFPRDATERDALNSIRLARHRPNFPHQARLSRNRPGSLAMLTAMRRASSRMGASLAGAQPRPDGA
jgi:hypothetical protein